jgi:6-pyruvoyl-tetrahydropterin synthase
VSTAENISVWIWDQLQPTIPAPARLHQVRGMQGAPTAHRPQVKLWETEKNMVTYCGETEP